MDLVQSLATWLAQFPGGDTAFTVLVFVVVLGVLVFVHEYGHYAAARSVGVYVQEFAVGFGPAVARWRAKNGTNWKVGIIPLGGYVQMKGQVDGEVIKASAEPDSFAAKTLWQRAWIVSAGPLANFVLALAVYTGLMLHGEEVLLPVVGSFHEEVKVAQNAGMQVGDVIQVVNAAPIESWDDLVTEIAKTGGADIELVVKRAEQILPILVTPQTHTYTDLLGDVQVRPLIGIQPDYSQVMTKTYSPVAAMQRGAERTWEVVALTYYSLYKLIVGAVSADNIAGPLGIADLASQSAQNGTYALLVFLAIISVNLGVINLLPVPILDGGHLVFFAIEGLKGSPVSEKAQEWSLKTGFALIICLFLFATSNDIKRQGWLEKMPWSTPVENKVDVAPVTP
ncbi:MAG: RIP metalloprotease RseP [Alphaproteobacteria bacterium]